MSAEQGTDGPPRGRYLALLSLGALGVVYGDIGTSPLYALRELGVRSGDQLVVPRRFLTYEAWIIGLQLVNTVLLAYSIFP